MAHLIGLDLGCFSIKVVRLSKRGKGYRLEAIGITLNPYGERPGADEASQVKVAETVKKLLSETKLLSSKVMFALPESLVYTRVVEMPVLSDSELASAIHWEAEQYVPVPLDQVNIDYQVIDRPEKSKENEKMSVFLVAAPKTVVSRTIELASRCGLEVVGLETEMVALSRAMVPEIPGMGPTMLVSLGASNINLAIMRQGMLVFTYSLESGGTALTRAISTEFGLEFPQAEEYKRTYGLDPSQLEGKVRECLRPLVDRFLSEARKAIQYYNSSNQEAPIKRVILAGGTALLPGLVAYTAENLGMEVVLGNAFSQIEPSSNAAIPQDTVSFGVAVGLGMRDL